MQSQARSALAIPSRVFRGGYFYASMYGVWSVFSIHRHTKESITTIYVIFNVKATVIRDNVVLTTNDIISDYCIILKMGVL